MILLRNDCDSTNKQRAQKQSICKQTDPLRLVLKKTDICLEVRRASGTHDKVKQVVDKERAGFAEALNTVVTRIRLIIAPFPNPHDKQIAVAKLRRNK